MYDLLCTLHHLSVVSQANRQLDLGFAFLICKADPGLQGLSAVPQASKITINGMLRPASPGSSTVACLARCRQKPSILLVGHMLLVHSVELLHVQEFRLDSWLGVCKEAQCLPYPRTAQP